MLCGVLIASRQAVKALSVATPAVFFFAFFKDKNAAVWTKFRHEYFTEASDRSGARL